jgi:hypothetical protein
MRNAIERSAAAHEYYLANRQKIIAKARAWERDHHEHAKAMRRVRMAQVRAWIREYKATHPCVDCGEADPIVLEFDHLPPSRKHWAPSTRGSLTKAQAEVEKCEVVCANCHARRTYARGGWPYDRKED